MTEPIIVEFEVRASPQHAFDTWTRRASWWWPRSHTVTGQPDATIVFEPFSGGRIYEQSADGAQHTWGEVLLWQPPGRIEYLWHLFFDPSEATEITVTFTESQGGSTVRLVQTGFDKLADDVGPERRRRTSHAWLELTGMYQASFAGEGS